MSAVASLITLLAALMVATAYPTKDDEAYYYNRLHDLPDNQKTRNLDGIDAKDDSWPVFVAKPDQGGAAEKGSDTKFDSGSHIDGIGGGHLVRNLEHEQGLGHAQPNYFDVDDYNTFGIVRSNLGKYSSKPYGSLISHNSLSSTLRKRYGKVYGFIELVGGPNWHVERLVGGNLLESKKDLDLVDGDSLLSDERYLDPLGISHTLQTKRYLDALGGGHLLQTKRYLDALGGGHLLQTKRYLDGLGGGHLLQTKRYLDGLGGGHLLQNKRYLDGLGGGHLLQTKRYLDSLGGGHLLETKRDINSLMKEDFVKTRRFLDTLKITHPLEIKRNLDSIGGGHLLESKRSVNDQETRCHSVSKN